jgi:hypothetical protein
MAELASVETGHVVGVRDRVILATLAYTACRAGVAAKLRLQDFQHGGTQYLLRFQEKGGKSREIPVRYDLEGFIRAYLDAAGIACEAKDAPLFRAGNGRTGKLACPAAIVQDGVRPGEAAAQGRRPAVAAVAAQLPGDGDHRPADARRAARRWPAILPPLMVLFRLSLGRLADDASARFKLRLRQCESIALAIGMAIKPSDPDREYNYNSKQITVAAWVR